MSLFRSETERALYNRLLEMCAGYEDGETGIHKCMDMACEALGLPEEVASWAGGIYMTESALDAGIPLSVIEGKTKLSDHFTKEQIKAETNEEEDECPHDEHDHGYCLDCGSDVMARLIMQAEYVCEGDR